MTEQFLPGPDTIHVWSIDLRCLNKDLPSHTTLLSEEELKRANSFHFPHLRRRFILRRAAYRRILSDCLNCPAQDIQLNTNAYGRPELDPKHNAPDLVFNTTSSEDVALFACTRHKPVGIDIEKCRPIDAPDQLIECFFSSHEKAQWQALSRESKQEAFFTGWTRKEAYVKARGQGLSIDLASFSISFDPACPFLIERGGNWRFHTFTPIKGYSASLAYQGKPDIVFMADIL